MLKGNNSNQENPVTTILSGKFGTDHNYLKAK